MIDKIKLIQAVKDIPIIAEKEQWNFSFDKEEGTLFYSPEKITYGAVLHQITDEYAIYIDKNYQPKGVMVEYFNANFIEHHDERFKELSFEALKDSETIKLDQPEDKKIKILKELFETTLIREVDANFVPA